jgi:hypothetical protein
MSARGNHEKARAGNFFDAYIRNLCVRYDKVRELERALFSTVERCASSVIKRKVEDVGTQSQVTRVHSVRASSRCAVSYSSNRNGHDLRIQGSTGWDWYVDVRIISAGGGLCERLPSPQRNPRAQSGRQDRLFHPTQRAICPETETLSE